MKIKLNDKEIELTDEQADELCEHIKEQGECKDMGTLDEYQDIDLTPKKTYRGRVPKIGDEYWKINEDGTVTYCTWASLPCEIGRFEAGVAFWTKEEAEKEVKRRRAEYKLRELSGWFEPDFRDTQQDKCYGWWGGQTSELDYSSLTTMNLGAVCFKSREEIEKSFVTNRQDWLDYLGVEEQWLKGRR